MNILEEIANKTRSRIEEEKMRISFAEMQKAAIRCVEAEKEAGTFATFPFEQALAQPSFSFICEVKKASPSKGIIAENFYPTATAQEYEACGADAISCLTEPYWFLGSDMYLQDIANTVSIPVLKKDFTVDEYMIYQAKTLGAKAVLLICSLLSEAQLKEYTAIAHELGLSALVEAHNEEEITYALSANARIIGVNNRNLKDFTVNLNNANSLRSCVPADVVFIAESGVQTAADVEALAQAGCNGALIGEALMKASSKAALLTEMKQHAEKVRHE